MLLAKERILNRRLMSMLAEKSNKKLIEEEKKNTYQDWIDKKLRSVMETIAARCFQEDD